MKKIGKFLKFTWDTIQIFLNILFIVVNGENIEEMYN